MRQPPFYLGSFQSSWSPLSCLTSSLSQVISWCSTGCHCILNLIYVFLYFKFSTSGHTLGWCCSRTRLRRTLRRWRRNSDFCSTRRSRYAGKWCSLGFNKILLCFRKLSTTLLKRLLKWQTGARKKLERLWKNSNFCSTRRLRYAREWCSLVLDKLLSYFRKLWSTNLKRKLNWLVKNWKSDFCDQVKVFEFISEMTKEKKMWKVISSYIKLSLCVYNIHAILKPFVQSVHRKFNVFWSGRNCLLFSQFDAIQNLISITSK